MHPHENMTWQGSALGSKCKFPQLLDFYLRHYAARADLLHLRLLQHSVLNLMFSVYEQDCPSAPVIYRCGHTETRTDLRHYLRRLTTGTICTLCTISMLLIFLLICEIFTQCSVLFFLHDTIFWHWTLLIDQWVCLVALCTA